MLQLLQNKSFGVHHIPEGWLIVAAGNPPEYNKSVREFDMVTLDRVRNITVEADLEVWKQYACDRGLHPSILAFLNLYPDSFYVISTEHDSLSFVTARGWEDLSRILSVYEKNQEPVTEELILQYIQYESVARNFYLFYDLFSHYTEDFAAENFFGCAVRERMKHADSTESIAVAAMLFSKIAVLAGEYRFHQKILARFCEFSEQFSSMSRSGTLSGDHEFEKLETFLRQKRNAMQIRETNNLLPLDEKILELRTLRLTEELLNHGRKHPEQPLTEHWNQFVCTKKEELNRSSETLLDFIKNSYELLEAASTAVCQSYFTSDLTNNSDCTYFLTNHVCESYLRHTAPLLSD